MLNPNDFHQITDELNIPYWELIHPFKPLGQEQSFNCTIEPRLFDKYKFDVKIYLKDSNIAIDEKPVKTLSDAYIVAYTLIMSYVHRP